MDKKDIYEHLAHIYLNASSKKGKKGKGRGRLRNLLAIAFISLGIVTVYSLGTFHKNKLHTETALFISSDATRINFNFNPAKKETYTIDLNKLNLSKFKTLGFSLKKTPYNGNIAVRVELTNVFKEKSEIYIRDISHHWQPYIIKLSQFKNISNYSEMSGLSYTVEVWNTSEDTGILCIDNIRFLR